MTTQSLRIGTAPDSWGVWLPDHPGQVPWQRFLDEVVEAGYTWIELGPYGYLPTDPNQLREELGSRGRKLSGGTVGAGVTEAAGAELLTQLRAEEHTYGHQSRFDIVCRLQLEET